MQQAPILQLDYAHVRRPLHSHGRHRVNFQKRARVAAFRSRSKSDVRDSKSNPAVLFSFPPWRLNSDLLGRMFETTRYCQRFWCRSFLPAFLSPMSPRDAQSWTGCRRVRVKLLRVRVGSRWVAACEKLDKLFVLRVSGSGVCAWDGKDSELLWIACVFLPRARRRQEFMRKVQRGVR